MSTVEAQAGQVAEIQRSVVEMISEIDRLKRVNRDILERNGKLEEELHRRDRLVSHFEQHSPRYSSGPVPRDGEIINTVPALL